MGRILRLYAIREIVLPTLMALLTITFILMIRYVYNLINLVLQPGVGLFDVLSLLVSILPSVLVFATPMAVLVGVLIGVGRMTLDREVLAIRASGVNLLAIFAPALVLFFIVSVGLFGVSTRLVPAMMKRALLQIDQMQIALANSLEPGRFYNDLPGMDAVLYFKEREPKTNRMLGITLEMEKSVSAPKPKPDMAGASATANDAPTSPAMASDAATTPASVAPEAGRMPMGNALVAHPERQTELTMIFASAGQISTQPATEGEGNGEAGESEITFLLENGSIHQLAVRPERRDYAVINFEQLRRRMIRVSEIEKRQHTIANAELRREIADQGAQLAGLQAQAAYPDLIQEKVRLRAIEELGRSLGTLRKELWQRRTLWLATFVFALVGIPLAIWVRPSGKSWGLLIAIVMMLFYYIVMQMGLSMVQESKPAGVVVAMLPNAAYGLIGALLWLQTLRS